MGRIRTIKPEFFSSEDLSALPAETHLFAAGLLCYSDDDGFFNANPGLVKAGIFPLREPSLSIQEMLTQLVNVGYIRLGTATDGKHYGQVVKFTMHQRVNRPTASRISGLQINWSDSVSAQGVLIEDSLQERKGKEGNKEGKGISPRRKTDAEPTLHGELRELIQKRWLEWNPDVPTSPWGAAAGDQLKKLLTSTPGWKLDSYTKCLDHMQQSDGFNPSSLPHEFLLRLPKYLSGPLNNFKQPKEGTNHRDDKFQQELSEAISNRISQ
jgi:hypothetical protein